MTAVDMRVLESADRGGTGAAWFGSRWFPTRFSIKCRAFLAAT